MEIFISAVLPVFALIACGFGAGKFKLLGPQSTEVLSQFVFIFALPALLIRSIALAPISDVLNINFIASYGLGMLVIWFISFILSRLIYKDNLESSAIQGVNATYGNTGYLGIPLGLSVFGSGAIVPASITIAVNAFLIIPLATIMIEASRNKGRGVINIIVGTLNTLAINPLVLSVLIGLAICFSGSKFPAVIDNFLLILGGAAGPCALVAIGLFVSNIPVKGIFLRLGITSTLKLVIFPAVVWCLVEYCFYLPPMWSAMAVIMAGTPLGATAFVVAQRYKINVSDSSASVVATTAISIVTLSILVAMLSG